MTGDTHETARQVHHTVRLVGVEAVSVQIPGTQGRLMGAPVLMVKAAKSSTQVKVSVMGVDIAVPVI